MDRLDSALKKIKKKKEMKEAAPLAAIGKGLAVAGKAIVKGGAKAAKVGAKGAAKGAKSVKTVTPKVMGGEVKKSAQVAKNVKPKSGPTIDVKATEVGGEIAKKKKETMAAKSSTPKKGQSKSGQIQKSNDITNKGKNQVDPQKNPQADKSKDKSKDEPKDDTTDKKKKGVDVKKKVTDVVGGVKDAYGKSSFTVREQMTFREWLEKLPVEELDEYAMAIPAIAKAIPAIAKTAAVAKAAAPYVATAIGAGGMVKKLMSKKDDQLGGYYDPSKKIDRSGKSEKPSYDNIDSELLKKFPNTNRRKLIDPDYKAKNNPNLSKAIKKAKDKLNRKKFNDKLDKSSPYSVYKKPTDTSKPGDNAQARAKIRDDLNKLDKNLKNKNK